MNSLKKLLGVFIVLILGVALFGCNAVKGETPTGDNVGAFGTYDALKNYLEKQTSTNPRLGYYSTTMAGVAAESANDSQTTATDKNFSQTNIQVAGVNESDRIITDGYNIYIISGNQLFIVDAETMEIVYTYTQDQGYLDSMYLYNGKLVVLGSFYVYYTVMIGADGSSSDGETVTSDTATATTSVPANPDVAGDVTSTTNNDTTTTIAADDTTTTTKTDTTTVERYQYGTQVLVLDVSDVTNVTVERTLFFEYSYLADSRMIDGNVYLIMNNYSMGYLMQYNEYIPRYSDSVISNDMQTLPANRIFFMPTTNYSYSFLELASFNVDNTDPVGVKAYLGSTYQIYMSQNNLYAVVYGWTYNQIEQYYDYYTYVMRFEIVNNELSYKAMAKVNGYPLNQFSMDEYDGVFRIATTAYDYRSSTWTITNQLYLLDATTDNTMNQISMLGDLGKPGERIYAVRYNQASAFVVTFVNTDPMYKLDLSDPENPVIVGELYEEGVSDYLHNISDNLMIGVGRQAETVEDWTRFIGVKVALYDVSDNDPVNIDSYLVEGDYSYSDVVYNHKAFVSFEPTGADFIYVAIPVYEYYQDYYGYSQSEYIFKINYSGSMELAARLSNMVESTDGTYNYYDTIERAVFIDNNVYTISYSKVQKYDINDGFSVIGSTELNPSYYTYWGYYWGAPETSVVD